jgi:hypothetical protein
MDSKKGISAREKIESAKASPDKVANLDLANEY